MTMMTMTHTEKQFLFNCGEHNWTDTWFDIFPEEIMCIIYKFVNKNVINELDKRFNYTVYQLHPDYEIEDHKKWYNPWCWQKYTFDMIMPLDVEKIYKFCNMKKPELRMYCKQYKIKQSRGTHMNITQSGLVENIWERYKGRELTIDEDVLISNIVRKKARHRGDLKKLK